MVIELKIGSHVGRWTLLRETRKNGRRYYECRCDCGNIKEIYYRSLTTGVSQSCGCLRSEKQKSNVMDLTGQRFGKLVVLCRDDENKHGGNHYWICECDCGNRKSIRGSSLVCENGTRSCGCDQRKVAVGIGKSTIGKNSARQIEENMMFHTNFQVIENARLPKNNTSGQKGVWWDKSREKWQAYIQVNGKRINLGRYSKKDDAIKARLVAEEEYFAPLIEEKKKLGERE